jgi:hypothetical protein
LHRAGPPAQLIVVELVGKLERSSRMVEPSPGARPREPTVDDRAKRCVRSSLAQGILEEWEGIPFALELRKEDKSLGAHGASSCLREEVRENRAGARPFPCAALRASRGERTAISVDVGNARREPKRVLRELGSCDRGAAGAGEGRRALEDNGDLGIRALRRKREVPGAVERIRDDQRQASVCTPSLVRGRAVVDE